jgi:hypothetical protein
MLPLNEFSIGNIVLSTNHSSIAHGKWIDVVTKEPIDYVTSSIKEKQGTL